jgi:hypothetical protein
MIDMADRREASAGEIIEKRSEGPRHRFRLPGFVKDEDIGLGDVIQRATQSFGIRACAGCGRRSATLNRWVVFRR